MVSVIWAFYESIGAGYASRSKLFYLLNINTRLHYVFFIFVGYRSSSPVYCAYLLE